MSKENRLVGTHIKDCKKVIQTGKNTTIGFDYGQIVENTDHIEIGEQLHISREAIKIFSSIYIEVEKIEDVRIRDDFKKHVSNMYNKVGTETFGKSYTDFMNFLAIHITLAPAFIPLAAQLLTLIN
ncbi:hypothetical protein VCHA37P200_50286 [Vibrio chagasii]|nr:hypothetical protein VCHA53O468_50050 [Vibrio chagasii]CAH7324352.1 hypothetical protein VCHA55O507_50051 [Vibrio chagasii]CAH7446342.1 hypothetical protein VCHA37P200_50286 [Vibrio chagasii]CAH7460378.1 hypothetical protein VCHA43P274_50050 [Vibrio chagasii]